MPILDIQNIDKCFRQGFLGRKLQVLSGLSLTLEEGEVYGFLGHNGAGKSTTMKVALGLLRADVGRVRVFDDQLVTPASRRRIGYLSEEIGLYPHLNAIETLQLVGQLHRIPAARLRARTEDLLASVGLEQKRHLRTKHYSKGMRQRLGVACALINDPDLVFLDEPYSGLDPVGRRELREVLLGLKARGKTIMMSSHIVPDVEAVCDRVGILSAGKISRVLDLHEVYADRSNDVEVIVSGLGEHRLNLKGFQGVVVARDSRVLIVRCPGDEHLRQFINYVYDDGGSVVGVRQVKLNLEEVFVKEIAAAPQTAEARDSIENKELIHTE